MNYFNKFNNSSSLIILIPNFKALSYLLPGLLPTITKSVFLLTLPDTLPPKFSILDFNCSP